MMQKLMKLFMGVPYIANNFIMSHVSLRRGIFGYVLCLKKTLFTQILFEESKYKN